MANKKNKMGRPNKYYSHVRPRFEEIKVLCQSLSEEQVARYIGISPSTWINYKKQYEEFNELIREARVILIKDLRNLLIQRAKGFKYEDIKQIEDENGNIIKRERIIKSALPDVASINLLLKNIDKENWSNDPQMMDIKKEELKIKKDNQW